MADQSPVPPLGTLSGYSTCRRIRILSDRFTAIATYHPNDHSVSCSRTKHPLVARGWSRFFVPRIFRLCSMIIAGNGFFAHCLVAFVILQALLAPPVPPNANAVALAVTSIIANAIPLVLFLLYTRFRIARWHGAEHMAIASYERTKQIDPIAMMDESTVHPKCGGRLLAPIFCSLLVVPFLAQLLHLSMPISLLLLLEFILQIDALIGFDRVPVFRTLSILLQRHITTQRPRAEELATAWFALKTLAAAHRSEQ